MATNPDDELKKQIDQLHQEKDRYWDVPASETDQSARERDYQEWLDYIAKNSKDDQPVGDVNPTQGTPYRYNPETALQHVVDNLNKQFMHQEMHVRKHHPDWTEEQIVAHLEKLRAEVLERQFGPKPLSTTKRKRRH